MDHIICVNHLVPLSNIHMKTFLDSPRPVWRRPTGGRVLPLALVLGVAVLAAGCGKKDSPAPTTVNPAPATNLADASQPAAPATTANVVAPPAAPVSQRPAVNLAASANADPDMPALVQLNRAIVGFRMEHHRNPNSVEEITAATGIQLPPPPPGKKYAFSNRGWVVLVDGSAK
jgi:hypothetical protein